MERVARGMFGWAVEDARVVPIYEGGHSEAAQQLAAELADVYLVWANTLNGIAERLSTMREAEARAGRRVQYGMRCHVIVRETEAEAWAAADRLISRIDPAVRAAFGIYQKFFGTYQKFCVRGIS